MKYLILIHLFLSTLILTTSCAKRIKRAVNDAKYSAWESVGVEKRDLFKREVANVKEEQEESGEAFKDALTKLKEVYSFDGGKLEREYNKLRSSYDDASDEARAVSESISKLDTVANDLFEEWKAEIGEIKSSELKQKSREQLTQTRTKYQSLNQQLKLSEQKMEPVLAKLKDQVTYLKHNLNAKAVAGLKTEGQRIEQDIDKLLKDIEASNKEAQEFIKTL